MVSKSLLLTKWLKIKNRCKSNTWNQERLYEKGIAHMGQKVHPLGFRLGITQEHPSNWFGSPKHYSILLQEDERIRNCIKRYVRSHVRNNLNYGGITDINVQRQTDVVQVEIHTAFPAMLTSTRNKDSAELRIPNLKHLKQNLQDTLLLKNRKLKLILIEIDKPYAGAIILAEYIALQLENRVAFRRTMKKAIELANKKGNVHGVKIQISGRLNGAEIARVEWAREGRVPLQTLRAQIDYCHYSAQTIYGVLGIKVWTFTTGKQYEVLTIVPSLS